jgi:tetratricopeptide (TPR) repeat protein
MIVLLVLALDFGRVWHDLTGHLANARGVKAFQSKEYAKATESFGKATATRSTPARQFNLGTAEVAAGDRERGAAALDKAMADPRLRADALYNRGTSALAAKAYDSAIRDYVEALKVRPNDPATKRNLEIAHAQKRAAEQRNQKGARGPQPQSQKPQPGTSGEQPQEKGETDLDALLRSVQQQEKEELSRMHKAKGEKLRVGW